MTTVSVLLLSACMYICGSACLLQSCMRCNDASTIRVGYTNLYNAAYSFHIICGSASFVCRQLPCRRHPPCIHARHRQRINARMRIPFSFCYLPLLHGPPSISSA